MAPISPVSPISAISRKRSSPSESDDDLVDDAVTKKRRTGSSPSHTPQPQEIPPQPQDIPLQPQEISLPTPLEAELFNDKPRGLLSRAIALALEHVGFDGASQEAMEAMCEEVESYANNFLYEVTTSMTSSRRAEPIPSDFKYALAQFNLPISSLQPHLRPPIPKAKVDIKFHVEQFEEQKLNSQDILLGSELSGEPDRLARAYIPTKFPSFPSKHTYKWTEIECKRETDPRKIREEAAKIARQGEEALRRLNKVSRAANERDIKKAAQKDPQSKERHKLWEQMMGDLSQPQNGKSAKDEDHSLVVNSERRYFRQSTTAKKRALPPLQANSVQL